ncbi:MAG: endonuclease domain-containing protein [Saprospiraceae bacterium]
MKTHEAIYFARNLRKNPTISESIFWELVRKRRVCGLKFLRQYKIEHSNLNGELNYFFVDFYCHELKLIVEIDGEIHAHQKEYDAERQNILEEMGYIVIRIQNEELNSKDILNKFYNICESLKSTTK